MKRNAGGVQINVMTSRPHIEKSKERVDSVLERESRSKYISSFATMKNNNDLTIDNFFQRFEEMQQAMIESKELRFNWNISHKKKYIVIRNRHRLPIFIFIIFLFFFFFIRVAVCC